jgi:hypothetical protein
VAFQPHARSGFLQLNHKRRKDTKEKFTLHFAWKSSVKRPLSKVHTSGNNAIGSEIAEMCVFAEKA